MKIKKIFKFSFVFMTSIFALSSCGKKDDSTNNLVIKKDGLLYGELVGDLYQTQYWDALDSWNLKNMSVVLHYDDGSLERVDSLDANIHYTFLPESPEGLPVGITSFTMKDSYFVDYKGINHEIKPRTFEGIRIEPYP